MLSLLRRNPLAARLWISDQRADDQRREATKIYDALEKLFEIERNLLLAPALLAVLAAIVGLLAFPPALSTSGWQGSAVLCGGLLLGVFLFSSVVIRLFSRGAHKRVLGELQLTAVQRRVQMIIKQLSDQDRAIRPLVQRYHLAEEKK